MQNERQSLHKEWSLSLRIFSVNETKSAVMWPYLQFPADLVTFTQEIFSGKLHFWCSECKTDRELFRGVFRTCQTSKIECSAKIGNSSKTVNYFHKTLQHKCLTVFWICLWSLTKTKPKSWKKIKNRGKFM